MPIRRARNPDAVGVSLLDHFVDRMNARGVVLVVCGVRHGMFVCFEKSGVIDKIGRDNVFLEQPVRQTSTMLAVEHAQRLVQRPCAICRARQAGATTLYYQI